MLVLHTGVVPNSDPHQIITTKLLPSTLVGLGLGVGLGLDNQVVTSTRVIFWQGVEIRLNTGPLQALSGAYQISNANQVSNAHKL